MYSTILGLLSNVLYFLTLFLLVVTIWYYYEYFRAKYKLYQWTQVPALPIIGCLLYFPSLIALYQNLLKFPKKYGRSYWGMAGLNPIFFTSDAKLLEEILSSNKHIDKSKEYKVLRGFGGNGLISGNGDKWRHQRKLLNPTFHFKILEQFMPIFNKHSNELVDKLDIETAMASTDILQRTKEWSLGQVTETVMGLTSDGLDTRKESAWYGQAGKNLLKIAMARVIRPNEFFDLTFYFSRNYWRERKILKQMNDRIRSIIRRKEQEYDNGTLGQANTVNEDGTKQKIVSLDLLIEYKMKGAQITESDMRDQAQTLMYAGYDTTASNLALAIYNLARNPEVQEKIVEEAYDVLGGDIQQEITIAHLKEMKYLDMALQESMRLTDSVPLIARELGEDIKFDGKVLPKGLSVIIALTAVHHDPEYYPDPDKFIPERFTPENCKRRQPYTYIPFSAGPRICIGLKYGMLATKVGLIKLVLNYKFVDIGHKPVFSSEIVAAPKNGIKVGFRPRDLAKN